MSIFSLVRGSVTQSIRESFSNSLFDLSPCQGPMSKIQKLTMSLALLCLFVSGSALALVGLGYLHDRLATLTIRHLMTFEPSYVTIYTPYLLSAAKGAALAAAGFGLLWYMQIHARIGVDLAYALS